MSEKAPPVMASPDASEAPTDTPYTTWTVHNRRLLVCLLGYLALASSLTATIYFPLIELLAERYAVSTQAINLTITMFIVVQGITPSLWSPLSDSWGRRPVYLVTFAIFTAASLGLSIVDRDYPALLMLRALQSLGSSAVVSLAYATVSDVIVHSERGSYLAPFLATVNVGPCIGPVVGGGVAMAAGDPRWCFRVLLIFGASSALLVGFLMPETGRSIVGNGAVPARGLWRTWWDLVRRPVASKATQASSSGGSGADLSPSEPVGDVNRGKTGKGKFVVPNPLTSLRLVFYRDTFLILWLSGLPSAILFCVQTSISPIFTQRYGFNILQVSLCFLAGGAGVLAAGFVSGKLMDWNYKHVARKAGFSIDRVRGDDMKDFPIEQARSRGSVTIIAVSMLAVVGYGWAVEFITHPAIPLILQAYIGCKCATLHQIYGALIVDVFPEKSGTAAASKNITRCALAGLFVAVLDPMVQAMGYGWVFTLLGLVEAITCVAAVITLNRCGHRWRGERLPEGSAEHG